MRETHETHHFRADEKIIEKARVQARAEGTTLSEQLHKWLDAYIQGDARMQRNNEVRANVNGRVRVGRKLTRDKMSER